MRHRAGQLASIQAGAQLGHQIRAAVLAELNLRVSVGVARNCFLAKLAASEAKPDGLASFEASAAVQGLLERTAVERIPGALRLCHDSLHLSGGCFVWRFAQPHTVTPGLPV